jgi:hypothetical protein
MLSRGQVVNTKRNFGGGSGRQWSFDTGHQLGRRGGFGTVYLGEADDGSKVAVKVIDLQGGLSARRLRLRESEIADKLGSVDAQHLIRVLDAAETNTEMFLVMELAEGSLGAHLEERGAPLTPEEAAAVLRELTAGLRELHQASVIHRDLKPDNVLKHQGIWKLADFGIARDADIGTQDPTFIGWGTWPYMAPESWRGQSPDFKTDLYSLGCIAYELLTAQPPFHGPEQEDYRRQHIEESPPDLAIGPVGLRRIVLRLLAKDPAERQQDARAVEEALGRVAAEPSETEARRELEDLAMEHATERAAEQAALSAAAEEAGRRAGLSRQAVQDLDDVLQDSAESIRLELPEVEYRRQGAAFPIASADASLELRLYGDIGLADVEGDTAVEFGEVVAANRRGNPGVNLGNVLYEDLESDGLFRWVLYRFRAQRHLMDYPLGPMERDHGLSPNQFVEHRKHMLGGATHVFVTNRQPLTPEEVKTLFAEAMAMPRPR